MDSRETKLKDNTNYSGNLSRSNRNSKLYRQLYGKYQDLDNLPVEDNTDEIDIDSLKKLLTRSDNQNRKHHEDLNLDILEPKKRNIDKNKVYDINKILEKARYENKKNREPENKIINNSKSILEKLGTTDYTSDYLKKETPKLREVEETPPIDNLEMTREMKYHTRNISANPLINQVMPNSDLSLDLLSDLKPTNNTIITEPIKENTQKDNQAEKVQLKEIPAPAKGAFFSMSNEDTSDIDIIKKPEEIAKEIKEVDNDFFTSSYEFSRKDFTDYETDESKGGNILKIILLIIAICIFAGVIAYFVLNYGINK